MTTSDEAAPNDGQFVTRLSREAVRLQSLHVAPGLHLVATPIGNLADITLRALAVLNQADVIYCEDTRHSRTLIAHYGIAASLKPYHEHNAEAERPRIIAALDAGKVVALISDAGTPLISDPGYKLVRDCLAAGFNVESLPGPSAVLTALCLAGLPTDAFFFAGFLPSRSAARKERLRDVAGVPGTLIFFEAPQRLAESLADIAEVLGARDGAVARELTKLHEELVRAPLPDLASVFAARDVKGEVVILVGPPVQREVSDQDITDKLTAALASMRLKDAAKAVADALGVPKTRVYALGLALKAERETS